MATGGTTTGGMTIARDSRATGGTTTATDGTPTGGTTTARGRKRQHHHHHHQRTNHSTIVRTFTSPDNLDLFKLIYSI